MCELRSEVSIVSRPDGREEFTSNLLCKAVHGTERRGVWLESERTFAVVCLQATRPPHY